MTDKLTAVERIEVALKDYKSRREVWAHRDDLMIKSANELSAQISIAWHELKAEQAKAAQGAKQAGQLPKEWSIEKTDSPIDEYRIEASGAVTVFASPMSDDPFEMALGMLAADLVAPPAQPTADSRHASCTRGFN